MMSARKTGGHFFRQENRFWAGGATIGRLNILNGAV